jgi:hypothetical protein
LLPSVFSVFSKKEDIHHGGTFYDGGPCTADLSLLTIWEHVPPEREDREDTSPQTLVSPGSARLLERLAVPMMEETPRRQTPKRFTPWQNCASIAALLLE